MDDISTTKDDIKNNKMVLHCSWLLLLKTFTTISKLIISFQKAVGNLASCKIPNNFLKGEC